MYISYVYHVYIIFISYLYHIYYVNKLYIVTINITISESYLIWIERYRKYNRWYALGLHLDFTSNKSHAWSLTLEPCLSMPQKFVPLRQPGSGEFRVQSFRNAEKFSKYHPNNVRSTPNKFGRHISICKCLQAAAPSEEGAASCEPQQIININQCQSISTSSPPTLSRHPG